MRILLAVDGSEHSERAARAVAALDWGSEVEVRLVRVVFDLPDVTEADMDAEMEGTLERARRALGPLEARAETAVLRGHAGTAIIAGSEHFGADLIVVGHRGRGPIAARLLGSVAADVAERATRPVLVVRGTIDGPIVIGDDGSPQARAARGIVSAWPAWAGRPIHVISVAVVGDPATGIIDAARELKAGLVVVGCRGHGGISALLGTTARAVVLGAPCSVLVVHAAGVADAGRTAT